MAAKIVGVYRIDYERGGNVISAYIAGFTAEDVSEYIRSRLGNVKIVSHGYQCRVDRFTEPVSKMVYENLNKIYGQVTEQAKPAEQVQTEQVNPAEQEQTEQAKTVQPKKAPKIRK